jgi:rSAM/selenodomain-associated transferase 1
MPTPGQQLIVFLKAPKPGGVKTRLAHTMGAEAACSAYRLLVETLFERIAGLSRVELRFTPDDAHRELESWRRNGWTSAPQGDGDLGERLNRAFHEAFAKGNTRVLIIGSDCPEITVSDIDDAWNALESHDLVLGPAADGGYWLVGLREPQPTLFNEMPWSTGAVLPETLRRCEAAGLKAAVLRIRRDVDTEADWLAWIGGSEKRPPT